MEKKEKVEAFLPIDEKKKKRRREGKRDENTTEEKKMTLIMGQKTNKGKRRQGGENGDLGVEEIQGGKRWNSGICTTRKNAHRFFKDALNYRSQWFAINNRWGEKGSQRPWDSSARKTFGHEKNKRKKKKPDQVPRPTPAGTAREGTGKKVQMAFKRWEKKSFHNFTHTACNTRGTTQDKAKLGIWKGV